jgi:hypothetical protein
VGKGARRAAERSEEPARPLYKVLALAALCPALQGYASKPRHETNLPFVNSVPRAIDRKAQQTVTRISYILSCMTVRMVAIR